MSDALTTLGDRVEQRFLHAVRRSGGILQHRADRILDRASRKLRRNSILIVLGLLGIALLVGAWVLFNLALHAWLTAHGASAWAHPAVAGLNLSVGICLLLGAVLLTPHAPEPLPRRRHGRQYWRRIHAAGEGRPALLAAAAPPVPVPAPDSLEGALGATIELGMLAARTIPQLVRALRRG